MDKPALTDRDVSDLTSSSNDFWTYKGILPLFERASKSQQIAQLQ